MDNAAAVYSTCVEHITPEIAKAYLSTMAKNRSPSSRHVQSLAKAMTAGKFYLTHQGIAFDANGRLCDGQHRLLAVVQSGTTQQMIVTRGLTAQASERVDQAIRSRSLADSMMIAGHPLGSKRAVSVARMWMALCGQRQPALHEVEQFINDNTEHIAFALDIGAKYELVRHASIMAVLAIGHKVGHTEELEAWAQCVQTSLCVEEWQTAAIRFRDYWTTIQHTGSSTLREEFARRAYTSIDAWLQRRPLAKLYAKRSIAWIGGAIGENE